MPDKVINYDNLTRFKSDLDPLLAEKAEAADVYSKTAFDAQLAGKQAKLTPEQIADIDAVPGKQDAMDPIANNVIDIMFGRGIDPVLENNSWATIRAVCELGAAANFWSLGDTKTDVGTDSSTRTFRICDMYNAYPGRVVFEQVELEATNYQWNPSSNTDSDGAYNDYAISDMRTAHLPAILLKYSSSMQSVIAPTSYIVAKNGNSNTNLTLTDKLFLPAEKEIFGSKHFSRVSEANVLTWFALYAANDNYEFRVKNRGGSAYNWWLRSPFSGDTGFVCYVDGGGGWVTNAANSSRGVAPCFSF